MDFYSLTRRELQTLCKKNKIPANMTNVAMADALKDLEIVEGIDQFLHPCESETAQSSIESPVRLEVTSPYVPPTGGRSTRRRNVAEKEPETAKPMTRSRRTIQKILVKDADESQAHAVETPLVAARTNGKKGLMASACRKMDSQLKECVAEEKKDVLITPAPSGVTGRRRAAQEESAVKRVYSTRRSVRLAEKNAKLLNEVENENSGLFKKDLFAKDGQNEKLNSKESSDELDGNSGITGTDASTTVEENSEKTDEVEVVSAEKLDTSIVNEGEPVRTIEEGRGNYFEADSFKPEVQEGSGMDIEEAVEENSEKKDEVEVVSAKKQDISIVNEGVPVNTIEAERGYHFEADCFKSEEQKGCYVEIEEVGSGFETEAAMDEQKCDKTEDPKGENIVIPLNVSSEVQESEGSHGVCISEIEITVENAEELNLDKDAGYEDEAADSIENVVLEIADNFIIDDVLCDTDIPNAREKEMYNNKDMCSEDVTNFNMNEEVQEINVAAEVLGEKEFNPDESSDLEAKEELANGLYQITDDTLADKMKEEDGAITKLNFSSWNADIDDLSERQSPIGDGKVMNLVNDTELKMQPATEEMIPETKLVEIAVEKPGETEIFQHEESTKAADLIDVPSGGLPSIKNTPSKQDVVPLDPSVDFPDHIPSSGVDDEMSHHQIPLSFAEFNTRPVVPTCLTPIKSCASKASSTKKRMPAFSDNKENIGSGGKLDLPKDRKTAKNTVDNVPKLDDLSIRKLNKMLKEKLEITSKISKNGNDNEAPPRPALQALAKNQ